MIEGEYKKIMASIVHLDQYLEAYGPETQPLRLHLRHVAARTFKERWPDEDFAPIGPPSRWLVVSQETSTAPLVPIFILIFLSAIAIFGGFSLYAPPNATLFVVLLLPALAIAPFTGLLQISSRGAHGLMQTLAQSI